MIHLLVQKDSVWAPLTKDLLITAADTLAPRSLTIDYPWDYGAKYRLEVDSVAGTDIYGKTTMPFKTEFSTLTPGDYCTLAFNMSGLDPGIPAFVELLDASDKPLRLAAVENGRAFFPFLAPGKYYARVVEDYDGNGQFDTGDYESGLQPDLVYYYPKVINIKKNWDKEEAWDVFGTPIESQKPKAVLKNKPKTPKKSGKKRTVRNTAKATKRTKTTSIRQPIRSRRTEAAAVETAGSDRTPAISARGSDVYWRGGVLTAQRLTTWTSSLQFG